MRLIKAINARFGNLRPVSIHPARYLLSSPLFFLSRAALPAN
uniref:Uncharacterized protein n=1 Tax=Anguilla anguilla TaxID=7936 RepID=A0A0E9V6J5_ANGAN